MPTGIPALPSPATHSQNMKASSYTCKRAYCVSSYDSYCYCARSHSSYRTIQALPKTCKEGGAIGTATLVQELPVCGTTRWTPYRIYYRNYLSGTNYLYRNYLHRNYLYRNYLSVRQAGPVAGLSGGCSGSGSATGCLAGEVAAASEAVSHRTLGRSR